MDVKAKEMEADVVIISEPNKTLFSKTESWIIDENIHAANYISNKNIKVGRRGKGKEFVWCDLEHTTIFSCYVCPNSQIESFEAY